MSRVTNAILTWSACDTTGTLAGVNAALAETDPAKQRFVSVLDRGLPRDWYGGNKRLECGIAIAAFNHIRVEDLLLAARAGGWEYPECVRLMVLEEWDDAFSVLSLEDEASPLPPGI